MGDEEGQAKQERLENLHLLDGLLARGRQDSQCAPGERREDGCRGSPPEGQGEEGGGAGNAGPVIEDSARALRYFSANSYLTSVTVLPHSSWVSSSVCLNPTD